MLMYLFRRCGKEQGVAPRIELIKFIKIESRKKLMLPKMIFHQNWSFKPNTENRCWHH